MSNEMVVIISIVFIAVSLFMLRKKVNVGLVMLFASLGLIIINGISLEDSFRYALTGVTSYKTIKLILIICLIMMLENIMRNSGMIKSMVKNLKDLLGSRRLSVALLPLVIGLLPSPGGARFSCPMIEEVAGKSVDSDDKSFVNYWFRHVWMDGFILYPGIILAAELSDIPVIKFFVLLIPFFILASFLGWVFGIRKIKNEAPKRLNSRRDSFKEFLKAMLPVILVIILYIILMNLSKYALEVSLAFTVVMLFFIKGYSVKQIIDTLKKAFPLKFIIIIIGVMIFRQMLFDSGAMDNIMLLVEKYDIPIKVLFLIVPFIGGFASGIMVTGISISFPILIPMGLADNVLYPVLAFVAGFAGVMTTPLHLCAVMTADFFKSVVGKLLIRVAYMEAVIMGAVVLLITFF